MIHRSPDNRQAHGDIDPSIETCELDRDMSLIVIHGDDKIELSSGRSIKEGIGRNGAYGIDPLGPGYCHRRRDLFPLFLAKESLLPGMGIEAGHSDPRLLKTPHPSYSMRQADDLQHALFLDPLTRVAEGNVGRDVKNTKSPRDQHQGIIPSFCPPSKDFCMTGKWVAGKVHRLLVEGRRDHRIQFTGQSKIDGLGDVFNSRTSGFGGQDAWDARFGIDIPEIQDVHLSEASSALCRRVDLPNAQRGTHITLGST